jgi:hypothetical protein
MKTSIIELVESLNKLHSKDTIMNSGIFGATSGKDTIMTDLKRSANKLLHQNDEDKSRENISELRGYLNIAQTTGLISADETENYNVELDKLETEGI